MNKRRRKTKCSLDGSFAFYTSLARSRWLPLFRNMERFIKRCSEAVHQNEAFLVATREMPVVTQPGIVLCIDPDLNVSTLPPLFLDPSRA